MLRIVVPDMRIGDQEVSAHGPWAGVCATFSHSWY